MYDLNAKSISPVRQDVVSYVLAHDDYDASQEVLIDPSIDDPHPPITRWQAIEYINELLLDLTRMNISSRETICVHMFNHVLYPILFLATLGAGCKFTGSNPAYTAAELTHHIRTSDAKAVITEEAHRAVITEAAQECGISDLNILFFNTKSKDRQNGRHVHMSSCLSNPPTLPSAHAAWQNCDDEEAARRTIAVLGSTSGTTGLPKMASRSHAALICEHLAMVDAGETEYEAKRLISAPFFHSWAAPLALIDPLKRGVKTYVMRRFDVDQFLEAIDRFEITEATCPPPVLLKLRASPEETRKPLKHLRKIMTAGASLGADLQNELVKMFHPQARIVQTWGTTESGWLTTFFHPERDTTGSVGRFLPGTEGKVVDDDGAEVPPGQRGELLVRTPGNMLGYFDNEEATAAIFDRDGFLRTGDIGYMSADGKVYILDRKKELIKVRGWQVAPRELEARLLSHGDVVDAAVIGVPLPDEGSEMPCAFVVSTHPWAQDSAKKADMGEIIKTYLLQYLARYKVRDCRIWFLDEIPKSISGKILKRELRKMVENERVATEMKGMNGETGQTAVDEGV
ncbi:MAG: hypothetical protein M1821_004830 [Bathelium mastoideum]|nr:MAG: hypothetical protein M1821_004830 [Bathelium mastoideum]